MQEYLQMWKRYFDFGGRSTRREFWMAVLFNFLASLVISGIDGVLTGGILSTIYGLAVLIPGLALSIRRLRDAGKAWGWIFITLVPLVGVIIYVVFLCMPSVPASNNGYGSNSTYTSTYDYNN